MNKSENILNNINELLSSTYPYKKAKSSDDDHAYKFSSENGIKYTAHLHHQTDDDGNATAHLSFSTNNNIKKTGSEGNGSHKVFGTVKHILNHHLENHPEVNKIAYSSDNSDESRKKFYKVLAKHIAKKHVEHTFGDDHYYLIHKKDLK